MKITTIIGTRPQLIKAAALSHRITQSSILQETIINTGQHFDDNDLYGSGKACERIVKVLEKSSR